MPHEYHFYDRSLETAPREELRRLQDEKLRRLARAVADNAFYREKIAVNGFDLAGRGIEDLTRIPFTTKAELARDQRAFPPFGRLLTYEPSRYPYAHHTSGTSGNPLVWLDTAEDWETWMRCWAYVYRAAGVTERDVAFFAFSFGPYISHWAALDGARRLGVRCLPGGGMSSLQRVQAVLNQGATVVLSTPTYALRLAEVAHEHHLDLARSAVRITIHAGEPGASVPHVRSAIEGAFGAACFDHAGATELGAWGFECEAHPGAIHLNEAEFIFETLDPQTGAPAASGQPADQPGELVATALSRSGMPAVRYRTGDMVVLDREPCACGRTFVLARGGVLGRADDMLIVRGVNVYPAAIDDLVRSQIGSAEYEVEIRRVGGLDELLLKIETPDTARLDDVARTIHERLNIRVGVRQVPAGSLPRYELKARRYKRLAPRQDDAR
ncbi:MAG TPA: phenylacetate--CoA ligase family protein [Terriglobia bacterium]|nr:phenylacetate--CoA ligase family protein [Terriglobia bacterium]